MITETDFTFVDGLLKDQSVIKISAGHYSGVIFAVNSVQPIEENDTLRLKYDLTVIDSTDRFKTAWLETSRDFLHYVGDIIIYILSRPDKIIGNDGTANPDSKQYSKR
jgi:hypothetical protein